MPTGKSHPGGPAAARDRHASQEPAARRMPGHRDVIYPSAPVHATLAQPAAGADALEDLRAKRALKKFQPPRAIS